MHHFSVSSILCSDDFPVHVEYGEAGKSIAPIFMLQSETFTAKYRTQFVHLFSLYFFFFFAANLCRGPHSFVSTLRNLILTAFVFSLLCRRCECINRPKQKQLASQRFDFVSVIHSIVASPSLRQSFSVSSTLVAFSWFGSSLLNNFFNFYFAQEISASSRYQWYGRSRQVKQMHFAWASSQCWIEATPVGSSIL